MNPQSVWRLTQLKQLKKTGSVMECCAQLENLTRASYPHLEEHEISSTRAGELVAQLVDWPEYNQSLSAMEQASPKQAYEAVKSLAQCIERSKSVAEATRKSQKGLPKSQRLEGEDTQVSNVKPCASVQSLPPIAAKQKKSKAAMRCRNCNDVRNFQRECPRKDFATAGKRGEKESRGPKGLTATLDTWSSKVAKVVELAGEQTIGDVQLLGQRHRALLDTGFQVSILRHKVLQNARKRGVNLDADCEEVSVTDSKPIFDASGN
ncbi:unnamed protein product [Nippostrongylus brasiliensis]|uniref:CCHC-type domain-containing protein n=1 Tax=Nippostrongylus brasiliensis TaxID=27835 RepID=A0A0N4YRT7_NIPBR|nr:unnamed protein product [Nippostrongylus brasiliensis]